MGLGSSRVSPSGDGLHELTWQASASELKLVMGGVLSEPHQAVLRCLVNQEMIFNKMQGKPVSKLPHHARNEKRSSRMTDSQSTAYEVTLKCMLNQEAIFERMAGHSTPDTGGTSLPQPADEDDILLAHQLKSGPHRAALKCLINQTF